MFEHLARFRRAVIRRPGLWAGVLLLWVLSLLAACGQPAEQGPGEGQPAAEDKPAITFGDLSWDSAQFHNRVAGFIVEHGYGYPVDYLFGDVTPLLQGLVNDDVQVLMEIWPNNADEAFDKALASGDVLDLGANFPDAPQGWYVPTYMIEGDAKRGIEPMAPDLRAVSDLPRYRELFQDPEQPDKGRFYSCPAGWVCAEVNRAKFEAYGLNDAYVLFDSGSDTALASSILSAYEQGEPWVGYYWEPTWVMGEVEMTLLEEEPYSDDCWNTDYACAYPSPEVKIAIHRSIQDEAPQVAGFFDNYTTNLEQVNGALAYMHSADAGPDEAAIWFLREHEDAWRAWVPKEVAGRVAEALQEVE